MIDARLATNCLGGHSKHTSDFMLVRFGGDAEKKERFNQGLTPMTAEDIAEAIFWSCTLPRNVNINRIQMMPITQAFSPFARSGGPTPVH